jgi:hypothetical protein
MTCIAMIKNRRGKLVMAGDRRVSEHWGYAWKCPTPKIRKHNNVLVGAAGTSWLCKLIVDIFKPPKIYNDADPDYYMFYSFRKKLQDVLFDNGNIDNHKFLALPSGTSCYVLVGVLGRAYIVEISDDDEDKKTFSRITIDDAPIPYAIGSGADSARPLILTEFKERGYNTNEQLVNALVVASEIGPGCDDDVDVIMET